jgi:transketolase
MAYYAALKQVGFVTDDELMTFKSNETFLYGHPSMNVERGIEFSSGSLGLGLALGVGTALGLRRRGSLDPRVFVLMGDGECNEGSVWESAISAAHFGLGNVVAIIDKNGLQYDGPTGDILLMDDLAAKWRIFGWEARTVDGHDVAALLEAMEPSDSGVPVVIIANTVKGKGVSFMENDPAWHHSRLSDAQLEAALLEVGGRP